LLTESHLTGTLSAVLSPNFRIKHICLSPSQASVVKLAPARAGRVPTSSRHRVQAGYPNSKQLPSAPAGLPRLFPLRDAPGGVAKTDNGSMKTKSAWTSRRRSVNCSSSPRTGPPDLRRHQRRPADNIVTRMTSTRFTPSSPISKSTSWTRPKWTGQTA